MGHVGDGNFHLIYLFIRTNPEELAEARRLNDRLVARALAIGGTSTGEHGVGYGKMKYLVDEHGAGARCHAGNQSALDPHNLMNPGKMVVSVPHYQPSTRANISGRHDRSIGFDDELRGLDGELAPGDLLVGHRAGI